MATATSPHLGVGLQLGRPVALASHTDAAPAPAAPLVKLPGGVEELSWLVSHENGKVYEEA